MILRGNCRKILYGELEGDQYYLKRLPQNSVRNFIDLGANVGLISILAKLLHPKMRITAIEPHKEIFKGLVENVKNLGYIKCINLALGNGQRMYLEKERKSNVCNTFKVEKSKYSYKYTELSIKSKTLYDIINITKYDIFNTMIKVDCEGAEEYILLDENSRNIVKKSKVFVAELHDTDSMRLQEKVIEFEKLFKKTHHIELNVNLTGNLIAVRK